MGRDQNFGVGTPAPIDGIGNDEAADGTVIAGEAYVVEIELAVQVAAGKVVVVGSVAVRAKEELELVVLTKRLREGDAKLHLGPAVGIAGIAAEGEVALVGEPDPLLALSLHPPHY